eukprot:IDg5804t1
MSYRHSAFYLSLLPSLTYLAEHLVDGKPHTNLSWAITVIERVALIARRSSAAHCSSILIHGTTNTSRRAILNTEISGLLSNMKDALLGECHLSDDVCYLTVLSSETLPCDQSDNAIDSSPTSVADLVYVYGISNMGRMREGFPGDEADKCISTDRLREELNDNSNNLPPILSSAKEESAIVRAQRTSAVGCACVYKPIAKKSNEIPAPMSMRISLECEYEYAVVIRDECVYIMPVVGVEAGIFPFTDVDATGKALKSEPRDELIFAIYHTLSI